MTNQASRRRRAGECRPPCKRFSASLGKEACDGTQMDGVWWATIRRDETSHQGEKGLTISTLVLIHRSAWRGCTKSGPRRVFGYPSTHEKAVPDGSPRRARAGSWQRSLRLRKGNLCTTLRANLGEHATGELRALSSSTLGSPPSLSKARNRRPGDWVFWNSRAPLSTIDHGCAEEMRRRRGVAGE